MNFLCSLCHTDHHCEFLISPESFEMSSLLEQHLIVCINKISCALQELKRDVMLDNKKSQVKTNEDENKGLQENSPDEPPQSIPSGTEVNTNIKPDVNTLKEDSKGISILAKQK